MGKRMGMKTSWMTDAQIAKMCELVDSGCIKADTVQPGYLSGNDLNEILGYGLNKAAETSAYVSHDISTVSDAIKKITNEFENYKENNMKKEVLFLAPSYEYAKAVVSNLGKRLDKKEIPYNVSPYPKFGISTNEVNVTIVYSDPLKWFEEMFRGKDSVFGKKGLVAKAVDRFFHVMPATPNMSLEKYIVDHATTKTSPAPTPTSYLPEIKKVHFSGPATTVIWTDGTKTTVMCQDGDIYSEESGLALCIAKKAYGNMPNFNNIFRKWVPEETAANKWAKYFVRSIEDDARRDKAIQSAYNMLDEFFKAENRGEPAVIDLEEIRGYLGEALE